jgi:phenylacetate-CoA ligase
MIYHLNFTKNHLNDKIPLDLFKNNMKNILENVFKEQKSNINKILNFTYNNKYSSFYKDKYTKLPKVNSYKDFQKIPFLEKNEILNAGLKNFTFTPQDEIANYIFSSGTTGKPLITAHNKTIPLIPARDKLFAKLGVKKILILFPVNIILHDKMPIIPKGILGIPGDINNLPLMVELMKEAEIDGIITTPTILSFLIIELKKSKKFKYEQIKWLELSGEFCTKQRKDSICKIFPTAHVEHLWAATETGGHKGYQCETLSNGPSNLFHPFSEYHFHEIVDKQGNILDKQEKKGEIIHTDLYKKVTPLIRYKTGDLGKIKRTSCDCGNNYLIEIVGRSNHDHLKLQGVILHTQSIEDSLDDIREYINPIFKMHVYEKKGISGTVPRLKLQLSLKKEIHKDSEIFREKFIQQISDELRLSSKSTLSDLVKKGVFAPLEIEFVENWERSNKSKNIVSHFNI